MNLLTGQNVTAIEVNQTVESQVYREKHHLEEEERLAHQVVAKEVMDKAMQDIIEKRNNKMREAADQELQSLLSKRN